MLSNKSPIDPRRINSSVMLIVEVKYELLNRRFSIFTSFFDITVYCLKRKNKKKYQLENTFVGTKNVKTDYSTNDIHPNLSFSSPN